MTELDRAWDNGWGKTLIYFAEWNEQLRRECERRGVAAPVDQRWAKDYWKAGG